MADTAKNTTKKAASTLTQLAGQTLGQINRVLERLAGDDRFMFFFFWFVLIAVGVIISSLVFFVILLPWFQQ